MNKAILALLIVGVLLVSGCLQQVTGPSEADRQAAAQREAQRQAAVQQCQQTYNGCQSQCGQYWLASDKENCNTRCTNDYQVCRSYT